MRIVYLTTAMHSKDYEELLATKHRAPNPSNQNFHTKLIAYLTKKHKVKVIARRYHCSSLFVKQKNTDNYVYPNFINIPILRNLTTIINGTNEAINFNPQYIVVDVLNLTLITLARQIKKRTNAKIIGVITDNPLNLTNVKKHYAEQVFKKALHCDAFIGLTTSLLKLFNARNKPTLQVPGFIPLTNPKITNNQEKYVYFGGALYARYGIDVLIETFKTAQPMKLKIAGHGPLRKEILTQKHKNIDFIGLITPEQSHEFSRNATININPRPFDSALDEYSIPSKLIDYIFTGVPTISTKNSELEKIMGNNVFWIGEVTVYSITNAINTINNDYNEWRSRAEKAKKLLTAALGPDKFLEHFNDFVKTIKN